jgi:ABC-2 type transport system ATP-binding protein
MHKGRIIASGAPDELTRSLEHDVCEVIGGDREALHALLAARPEVIAASPAGTRLRVVITPGGKPAVEQSLAAHAASLRKVAPDFEDLFLARVANEAA